MAILPDKNLLEGTKKPETTTGEFRLAMGNLRQFIADLFGTDSADKQDARDVFGAQEKYRADAAGTADALTAAFTPPILKPLHGLHVQIRAKAASTTAVPTFRADETGALPIVKGNNLPLLPGDIAGDGHWLEMKYDATLNKWVLENPAFGVSLMPVLDEKADKTELMEKLDKSEGIPSGLIAMYSGAADHIPSGWLLCNGENGTPDLRDRFVVGAGKAYAVYAKGGATTGAVSGQTGETTLTINQIPSHNHGVGYYISRSGNAGNGFQVERTTDNFAFTYLYTTVQGGNQPHSHSLSGSVSTVPPYYALCFILKQ
ncbi:hypothetical protein [Oxalobacter paraformigenes]|uniref:Tail fiber protein n=1 Tax=Oxalobacter paraformigenes TaxID=556268 RepID=C3X3W3_9BURK|nr:hypothetical protein [Oxalobacter paraformigenes]EEO27899.1 hypothetical protein OFAG_01052 [Oxalobacter paraformigenes]